MVGNKMNKINIEEVIKTITKPWMPIDLGVFDNKILRIALFKGEYHEHDHPYDELFLVYRGNINIWTEREVVELNEGESIVIPKGLKHKPSADKPAYVFMIDEK
jgi:quercetin dioxygenase-like cupin family protein